MIGSKSLKCSPGAMKPERVGPRLFRFLACVASLLTAFYFSLNLGFASYLREEAVVTYGGRIESWRIEWLDPPKEVCAPKLEESATCSCAGFSYAEYGQADLVRIVGGKEVDRFYLTSLFEAGETPIKKPAAVLPRWPILHEDFLANAPSVNSIKMRPPAQIMDIEDFNHDGWASEFILQIGANSCFHRQSVLVGVTPDQPLLHAFGTVKSPKRPLIIEPAAWRLLKKNPHHARYVSLQCGDHAASEQVEIILSIEKNGIRAIQETFACKNDFKKGRLLRRIEI